MTIFRFLDSKGSNVDTKRRTSGRTSVPLSSLPRGSKRVVERTRALGDRCGCRAIASIERRNDSAAHAHAQYVRSAFARATQLSRRVHARTHARTHARSHTPSGRGAHCVTVTTLSFYVTSRARPTNMRATKVAARPISIDPLRFAWNSDETADLIGHRSTPAETKVSLTGNF